MIIKTEKTFCTRLPQERPGGLWGAPSKEKKNQIRSKKDGTRRKSLILRSLREDQKSLSQRLLRYVAVYKSSTSTNCRKKIYLGVELRPNQAYLHWMPSTKRHMRRDLVGLLRIVKPVKGLSNLPQMSAFAAASSLILVIWLGSFSSKVS